MPSVAWYLLTWSLSHYFQSYIHCIFHITELSTSFAYILHYCLNYTLIDGLAILQSYPSQVQSLFDNDGWECKRVNANNYTNIAWNRSKRMHNNHVCGTLDSQQWNLHWKWASSWLEGGYSDQLWRSLFARQERLTESKKVIKHISCNEYRYHQLGVLILCGGCWTYRLQQPEIFNNMKDRQLNWLAKGSFELPT